MDQKAETGQQVFPAGSGPCAVRSNIDIDDFS
jgi:hypothetical protein